MTSLHCALGYPCRPERHLNYRTRAHTEGGLGDWGARCTGESATLKGQGALPDVTTGKDRSSDTPHLAPAA